MLETYDVRNSRLPWNVRMFVEWLVSNTDDLVWPTSDLSNLNKLVTKFDQDVLFWWRQPSGEPKEQQCCLFDLHGLVEYQS